MAIIWLLDFFENFAATVSDKLSAKIRKIALFCESVSFESELMEPFKQAKLE